MRFALVPTALLALIHSLTPGVHGVPMVASDHPHSLAVRQEPASLLGDVTSLVQGLLEDIVGPQASLEQIEQTVQSIVSSIVKILPRADPVALAPSAAAPASQTRAGSTNASSISPSKSPVPRRPSRRQQPTSLPPSSSGGPQSAQSSSNSAPLVGLASTTSSVAASKPTGGNPRH